MVDDKKSQYLKCTKCNKKYKVGSESDDKQRSCPSCGILLTPFISKKSDTLDDSGTLSGNGSRRISKRHKKSTLSPQPSDNVASIQEYPDQVLLNNKEKFGRYKLLKKLGEGAMGKVYLAYDPELRRNIAIKMLIAGEAASENQIERFMQEARAAARLHHPNIVAVHNIEKVGEQNYFTMDFIEGESLSQAICKWRFAPHKAMYILLKIAHAMHYAHTQGIIHRDLKPANIILDRDGEPHVTDFGLAKEIHGDTKLSVTGVAIGTPAYMSPEQARGEWSQVDERSDVYSIGVILYEMLTQHQPFEGQNVYEIISSVLLEDPIPPHKWNPRIHRDVEIVCLKCMEKDKDRRYSSAEELFFDIDRYLKGDAILATSPGLIYRSWRKVKRNGRFALSITVLVLLVIWILVLWRVNIPDKTEIQVASLKKQAEELTKNRNLKGAKEIYLSILELDKDHIESKIALDKIQVRIHKEMMDKAFQYEKEGDLKEALRYYEEILVDDKDYKEARAGKWRIKDRIEKKWNEVKKLENDKDFDQALQLCQELVKWDPKDERFDSKYILEITQKKETCRKEARKFYDRAMEVFWNPRLEEEELKRCKILFEKAIRQDPTFADAHFQAGRASHRLFDTNEAIRHYINSMECDCNLTPPKYYMTALELSIIVSKFKEDRKITKTIDISDVTKEVEEKFDEIWSPKRKIKTPVINLNTEDPYSLLAKAQFLLAKVCVTWDYVNTWEECLSYCNKVIKECPYFSDVYLIRAQLYSYMIEIGRDGLRSISLIEEPKDLNQALEDCSKCIYLDPYRVEAYSLRATIYQSIGAYELAEKDFTKALLMRNVEKASLYRDRAICYMAMGNLNLALADLNENLRLIKENTPDCNTKSEIFVLQALLNAFIGEKKLAEEALNSYLSSSFRLPQGDGFVKALTYFFIDDNVDRAIVEFKSFLDCGKEFIKPFQLFIITNRGQSDIDVFTRDLSAFFREIPNLFCTSPNLKKLKAHSLYISSFPNASPLLQRILNKGRLEFSIISKIGLESVNKFPEQQKKFSMLNLLCSKDYAPLTAELILYCTGYLSDNVKIQKFLNIKELPSASLYYRRAVEYYLKKQFDKAKEDLEAALELEPDFMEAHYGLSTVDSLLSTGKSSYEKALYRENALYHLKRAIESGWKHLEDYTLQDSDFKPLDLGKDTPIENFSSCTRIQKENQVYIDEFKHRVEGLISRGKKVSALRLFYDPKPVFFSKLNDLLEDTERKVMEEFIKRLQNEKVSDLDREVEKLFGERGKIIWEWAKRNR